MEKVVEKDVTIVGANIVPEHPELHHYTTEAGLRGILDSNCIRATNYQDLNDSSEVTHLREHLRPVLVTRFREILRRRRSANGRLDRALKETGGLNLNAERLADDVVNSFYRTSFEPNNADPLADTAGTPYIASFCTHSRDQYERDNGLLSQWRGYSGSSGFCIVFDTVLMASMLGREFDTYAYTHLNLSPAFYAVEPFDLAELFPGLVGACDEIVSRVLTGRKGEGDQLDQFFSAATVIKHRAFREEQEVRVVAIPVSDRMRAMIQAENVGLEIRTSRPEVMQSPSPKRFLELFRGSSEPLPIKRIIVGPGANQPAGLEAAINICAGRCPVMASQTPFKG
jgi:Protein of unknown function (DUF2971)